MKESNFLCLVGKAVVGGVLATMSLSAYASDYNQLSFSTQVQTEVANDEIRAVMYKKSQSNDSKSLAIELNKAINEAMKVTKRYPTITVNTGAQSTYPRYSKNSKIIGWTGQASIELQSTDFEATSQLIADLQDMLVLDGVSFGVSQKKRDEMTEGLLFEVSKKFQTQAKMLSKAWNASDYKLVNVRLNQNNNGNVRFAPMMLSRAMNAEESVPAQNFEGGNSTISVTANGTIELVR